MLQTTLDFTLNFPEQKIEYLNAVHSYRMSQTQKFGFFIERHIQTELIKRGYDAQLVSDWNAPFDVLVDGALPLEIKGARPTRQFTGRSWRDRWQFCLQGGLKDQDFVYVLCLVDDHGELFNFIIPSAHIAGRQAINITSHPNVYSGMWQAYLNAWEWLDTVIVWRIKYDQTVHGQLSLFEVAE